jgi:transposase InsO family protein
MPGDADILKPVRLIDGQEIDTSCWPSPDIGALSDSARAKYLARREAVILYLEGASEEKIRQRASIGLKQVYRLIRERCIHTHEDGLPYGWRALIAHARINPYRRQSKLRVDKWGHGAAGAMQVLLFKEPELAKALDKHILRVAKGESLEEIKRGPKRISDWLIKELRRLGYEVRNEWPFNVRSTGYWAIYRYYKALLAANPHRAAGIIGGPSLQRKLRAGDGVDRPVKEVLQRIEMDAHKLDGLFCVMMPQLGGGWKPKMVHRLWVTVVLDVVSRAVLGYHLSVGKEVSKEDVLNTIKSALTRWEKRILHFSDVAYQEEAALPSAVRDDWVGLCWNETSVDGALAETCKTVRTVLNDVVGSELLDPTNSFSVRRTLDDRPFIEAFFRTLGSRGFQRLSNTTGGKHQDKKGRKPDEVALNSQFQYEYAEELLDVLIANYNATPHSALGNRSPLDFLQFALSRPDVEVRRADPAMVEDTFSFRKICTVKGGASEGRAPYINFVNARYSGDTLSNRHDLVGRKVWVINHLQYDARVVRCTTLDGHSVGILRAAPPWHVTPHSLRVRRASCALEQRGMFAFDEGCDGVKLLIDFVERQPDKKFPVHPAYLEARRILVGAAEDIAGTPMVAIAKERGPTGTSPAEPEKQAAVRSDTGTPRNKPERKRALPARRMAATS